MKILIATESYYPIISGVAVFSNNLAKIMAERGHEVIVLAPSPKLKAYEETFQNVKIYRLPSKPNKFRQNHYNSSFPFNDVKRIMNEVQPDVVHLQDPMMISFATAYQAKRKKIPIVITNHFSLEYIVSYLPLLKPIHPLILFILTHYLNWFYAKANVLTCPTKTIAEHFTNTGIKIKVDVISNGVDLSRFMPHYGDLVNARKHYIIPLRKPLILYVGRLDIDKHVDEIIKSMPKVLQKIDAHLVIVGDGKEKEKLTRLVSSLKIEENVTFTGFIAYDNLLLPEIYQTSSVFVNACPMETQSIVTLEAEATGLPVVVADSGALVELVENGVNGYRFKPKDQSDLSDKLVKILTNSKLAQKMGDKSLEKVEEHVVEDTHDGFEKIYKDLVK